MPTLLDTHAWVWWVTSHRRLSRTAARVIDKAQTSDGPALSLMSVWEVARKVRKGQLVLDRRVDDWLDLATAGPGMHLVELTRPIHVESFVQERRLPVRPGKRGLGTLYGTNYPADMAFSPNGRWLATPRPAPQAPPPA